MIQAFRFIQKQFQFTKTYLAWVREFCAEQIHFVFIRLVRTVPAPASQEVHKWFQAGVVLGWGRCAAMVRHRNFACVNWWPSVVVNQILQATLLTEESWTTFHEFFRVASSTRLQLFFLVKHRIGFKDTTNYLLFIFWNQGGLFLFFLGFYSPYFHILSKILLTIPSFSFETREDFFFW